MRIRAGTLDARTRDIAGLRRVAVSFAVSFVVSWRSELACGIERPILAARPGDGGRKNCHSTYFHSTCCHNTWRFHFGHLAFPIFVV